MQKRPGSKWIVVSFVGLWLVLVMFRPATAETGKPPADPKSMMLTTNLLSPWFGAYYADVNLRASDAVGVLLNASYFSITNDDWKTNTGTVGAGLSYHWQGDCLRRWYVEASSELMVSSWRHEPSEKTAPLVAGFTVGSVVGYRFVWESGPVFDLAAGFVMLRFPSAQTTTDAGPVSSKALTRLYPAIKVNAGWAF